MKGGKVGSEDDLTVGADSVCVLNYICRHLSVFLLM